MGFKKEEQVVYDFDYIADLKYMRLHLTEKAEQLKEGDIVCWKHGLRNRTYPEYDQPCIVVEKLKKPVITNKDNPYSSNYREPLDIIIGFFDEYDEFITFYYDSRRFQIYNY